MRTKPLKGPEKICRSHCFLGLPLKGFLLCLGILATRKRVYEFLDAYLVGYLVLLQLILDVSFNCFFVSPYCIYEIPSGPEMSVSILVLQIRMSIKYHQRTFSFQISHYFRYTVLRWYTRKHMNIIWHTLYCYYFYTFSFT